MDMNQVVNNLVILPQKLKTLFFGVVTSSSKQKTCKLFNIWFQYKKTTTLILKCATVQLGFSCCRRPLSRSRVFPPAASAITSDVAQPRQSFQARSSQTAETQLTGNKCTSSASEDAQQHENPLSL